MTDHLVDTRERRIDSDDLACWLLFFLEESRRRGDPARGPERVCESGPDARTRRGDRGSLGARHYDPNTRVSPDPARPPCGVRAPK